MHQMQEAVVALQQQIIIMYHQPEQLLEAIAQQDTIVLMVKKYNAHLEAIQQDQRVHVQPVVQEKLHQPEQHLLVQPTVLMQIM